MPGDTGVKYIEDVVVYDESEDNIYLIEGEKLRSAMSDGEVTNETEKNKLKERIKKSKQSGKKPVKIKTDGPELNVLVLDPPTQS